MTTVARRVPRVRATSGSIAVSHLAPLRPWYPAGATATVHLELSATEPVIARARLELLDVDRVVAAVERKFRLPAGRSSRRLRVALPLARRHGYGLALTVHDAAGRTGRALSAVEALEGWWESPRHAVLVDFEEGAPIAERVAAFADWHVTVAQFYDWMWRHYRYEPPAGNSFMETLGGRVSQKVVRAGVAACHAAGIAALAYGSVYGAEREYVDQHPDERLFDDEGRPLSLGETFFITDLRPGSPWRRRLLDEYQRACSRFGFDGIHMDTYGQPHEGFAADGTRVRFAEVYPGLVAEAAERLAPLGRHVQLNCVDGFPLEAVAAAPSVANYLELWPPDVRYADVVQWIERARRLGEGRQVVIAAYLSAMRAAGDDPRRRAGAVEAGILLTCVISVAGGYHQVLAEHDRLLVEGYYPEAVKLTTREFTEMRAAWQFGARYVHLLSDPALKPEPVDGLELRDGRGQPVPVSETPEAGRVWVRIASLSAGGRVTQLVDLRRQHDDHWDAEREAPEPASGWSIRWRDAGPAPVAMSPWTGDGSSSRLPAADDGPGSSGWWRLPRFRRWLTILDR